MNTENLYITVKSINELEQILQNYQIVIVYFSHQNCNVCKVLKPKVANLLKEYFPKAKMVYADTVENPDIAGQNRIFAVPTIVGFIEGKEFFRKSRSIGLNELAAVIERPYNILFSEVVEV